MSWGNIQFLSLSRRQKMIFFCMYCFRPSVGPVVMSHCITHYSWLILNLSVQFVVYVSWLWLWPLLHYQ